MKRANAYKIITANTPLQPQSAGVDQDGTDFSYFASFTFGSSQETYYMLLDSGASDSWVMGADCTAEACNAHNTLGSSDSKTLKVSRTNKFA